MRFILLSDIHATSKTPVARKDDVLHTSIDKIKFVLNLAKERNTSILQSGDFFDKPRDWNLLLRIINLVKKYNVKIYTVYGQHDTYLRSDLSKSATTLGILYKTNYFQLLSKKPVIINHVYLYGSGWGQEVPEPKGRINILVIHAPISMSELYPDHKYTNAKWFAKKFNGYNLILAGDIHRHFFHVTLDQTTILNTGPMLRLEANEYNMTHSPCGFIYDTETGFIEKFTIPHEPAELILTRSHIEKSKFGKTIIEKFMESIEKHQPSLPHEEITIKEMLVDYLRKEKTGVSIQRIITEAMEDES